MDLMIKKPLTCCLLGSMELYWLMMEAVFCLNPTPCNIYIYVYIIFVAPIRRADQSVCGFRPNHKTVELSSSGLGFFVLRLVTSTCAGYDDDAQICCEHGGEGGQNVSLTAGVHEQQVTGGGGWFQPSELFILLLSILLLSFK